MRVSGELSLNFPVLAENVPACMIQLGELKSSPGVPAAYQSMAAATSATSAAAGKYMIT